MTPPNQIGQRAILVGLIALGIYLVMIKVTLAHLNATSGLPAFDMRPGGYSIDQAHTLLNALGATGRRYYLTRQIPLDLLYPGLMAWTLVLTFRWLGARAGTHRLVAFGAGLSIMAAVADYIENLGIVMMILTWPGTAEVLIQSTSFASVAKAGLTTLAVLMVCLVAAGWAFQNLRRRI